MLKPAQGDASHCIGGETQVIEAGGQYLAPGFMDGHIHVESSMVGVGEYARAVIPHGTTGIFMDPHEICNVLGLEGVSCMAEDDFHIMDIENLRLHYNKTLLCWADNFHRHMEEEKKMFDERFLRMWDLYLNACAATFHNGIIDIHQIVATKGINNDYPMVRWY